MTTTPATPAEAMLHIEVGATQCCGYKCREPNCISCFGEESVAESVNANIALLGRIQQFLSAPATNVAAESGEGDGWLPMVSAPLDGTYVELMIRHHDYWTALKLDGKERAEHDYQMVCRGQWLDHNRGGWCWAGLAGTQVGWRPLDVLSAQKRGGEGGE